MNWFNCYWLEGSLATSITAAGNLANGEAETFGQNAHDDCQCFSGLGHDQAKWS